MLALDRSWLGQHPLPSVRGGDKNVRGRVLVVGGAEFVPGALRLTGEAALRAGAGKLQLATVRAAAVPLAVLMPEASMIALPADDNGEIAAEAAKVLCNHVSQCDALVVGPGMSAGDRTDQLVASILQNAQAGQVVVLDAAALTCCRDLRETVAAHRSSIVMTPHHGEMANLMEKEIEVVREDPTAAAMQIAEKFQVTVVLKGQETIVTAPDKAPALFTGGSTGLATSGSGDVLAGIIGGFAARGAAALTAAGWGVFVHGAAGEAAAHKFAPVGFLARDLLPTIPSLTAGLGGNEC